MKISLPETIQHLLKAPYIASEKPIYEKYDKNVQGNTIHERGNVAASICAPFRDMRELDKIHSGIGVGIATGGNPFLAKISAQAAAENAMAEAVLKITCVGGEAIAATDCLNFGNPEKPEQMGEFVAAINGLKKASELLNLPFVSGNVSFYNESSGRSIPPSALVSVFGRIKEPQKVPPLGLPKPGEKIFLIGTRSENLGGSAFLKVLKKNDSRLPVINWKELNTMITKLKNSLNESTITSIQPILRGGLIIALLKSAFQGHLGIDVSIPESLEKSQLSHYLFSEDLGVILTTPEPEKIKSHFGDLAVEMGTVVKDFSIKISHHDQEILHQELNDWHKIWSNTLRAIF